jgi:glutamyl-tRNA reductase
MGALEILPTLAALRTHANDLAEQIVAENAGKWESASPRDLTRVEALARAIVNRLLHEPTVRMKETRDDRVHARMAMVRDLFGLADPGSDYTGAGEESAAPDELAEIRTLPQRRR